jgi:hypothetical protein
MRRWRRDNGGVVHREHIAMSSELIRKELTNGALESRDIRSGQ